MAKEIPVKNILTIGGFIVGFIVVKKLLEAVGVLKTAEEKANEEASNTLEAGSTGNTNTVKPNEPALSLNPNYWKTILVYMAKKQKVKTVPATTLNKLLQTEMNGKDWLTNLTNYAGRVYSSKGLFNDDESRLYSVFQNLKSQLQISYMAKIFSDKYKKDMLDYIKGYTNEEERAKIFNIVKNKSLY